MPKITLGEQVNKSSPPFKKGDLVLLREGQHHHENYIRRPVIVTKDVRRGDTTFGGFCLVDCFGDSLFQVDAFELATISVVLSN